MNLLPAIFLLGTFTLVSSRGLREEFSWSRISYEWPPGVTPSVGTRSRFSDTITFPGYTNTNRGPPTTRRPVKGHSTPKPGATDIPYIYQNNIPMGANVWKDKLFITVPRRRPGVPSTLNYVRVNSTQRHNVPLIPYPDWETNTLGETSRDKPRFVSVYRVAVDSCDRLWFIDTGRIETPGNREDVQPHTLNIMDLKTDRIIHQYVLNSSLLTPSTTLHSVTVDIDRNKCGDAFAYMPDLGGYGLIVYDLKRNRAWRLSHVYFYVEPLAGDFSIGGHTFQWNDGIFSVATSDAMGDGSRHAYFHSMAGFNQYRVSTRVLQNEDLATRSYHGQDFEHIGHRGNLSQTSSSDLHKPRGILFLGLVNQNAVACWNIATPLSDISIVQKNDQKMIYPSDVKISGNSVIVLTNTMPVFLYGTLDYDQTNFRVWVETVDTAVKGTKCDKPPRRRN